MTRATRSVLVGGIFINLVSIAVLFNQSDPIAFGEVVALGGINLLFFVMYLFSKSKNPIYTGDIQEVIRKDREDRKRL